MKNLTFEEIRSLIARLAIYENGDAYNAFRESILKDLESMGYTRESGQKLIDDLTPKLPNGGETCSN